MWKDVSSFSQRSTGRTPRTFNLSLGGVKLTVTRHIAAKPDQWVIMCPPFINHKISKSLDIDAAKAEAVGSLRSKLNGVLIKLNSLGD